MPRNRDPLVENDIAECKRHWQVLKGGVHVALHTPRLRGWQPPELIVDEALRPRSRTRFVEGSNLVMLGCGVLPGGEPDANSRMSLRACMAHELAHAHRYFLGFRRPLEGQGRWVDEAETSLHATFNPHLTEIDVRDLIEDAEERLARRRSERWA